MLMFLLGTYATPGLTASADYEIGPDDVLSITVYDHADLSLVARVDTEGLIIFPLAGHIKVGGLTTAAASKAIADKLAGEYVINPQVNIFVQEFRSKKVVIIGEVVRPGLYELSGPTTLLELISKAGGLSESSGQSATIRRALKNDGNETDEITVNVVDLLESGLEAVDVPLIDGDTITVAKAGVVYVTGQVNRPAAYPIEPGTTVIKAITMAGGFTPLAAQGKVKIIRKIDGNENVLEKVSLYEVLQEDDVMVVPESFF
jgi:polysaccharide export outer membrane protein